MLVDKNIKKIQVPAVGKTISVPAVAAAVDSRTMTEPPQNLLQWNLSQQNLLQRNNKRLVLQMP
jgi:hypothetical protein